MISSAQWFVTHALFFSTEFAQIAAYSTQAILWPKRQSDPTFSIEAVRSQESQAVRKVASAIEFLDHWCKWRHKFVAVILKKLRHRTIDHDHIRKLKRNRIHMHATPYTRVILQIAWRHNPYDLLHARIFQWIRNLGLYISVLFEFSLSCCESVCR